MKLRRAFGFCQRGAALGFIAAIVIVMICETSLANDAERRTAARLIKETISGAKSSAEAAASLISVAKMLADSPEIQADFCRKAYEYGVKTSAGQEVALAAIEILIGIDPDGADQWRQKRLALYRTIYSRSKAAQRPAIGVRIVELTTELADAKARAGQWSEALKFYASALRSATALKLDSRAKLADRVREVTAELNRFKRFEALKKKLAAEPDNQEVRSDIIELCLLEYDSPARAAQFVSEDDDETLRTYMPLAARPIKEVAEAQCLELGLWYRSLAGGAAAKTRKTVALNRSIEYLQRYLELHQTADPDREKASGQLSEALAEIRKLGGRLGPQGAALIVTFERRTVSTVAGKKYLTNLGPGGLKGLMLGGSLVAGRAGSAMKFDGKAYVDLGNPAAVRFAGSRTTCMWLKPANLSARQNPLNKCYGGEGTWTLEVNGTVHYFCGSTGRNEHPYSGYKMPKPLKAGQWSHLAGVRDAKTRKIHWYKDGVLVKSFSLKQTVKASKYPLLLGKGYVRNYYGLMDEVAIYNRALSPKEIKTICEMGQKGLTLK